MFFWYWLGRAKKGDSFSAGLMWSVLHSAAKKRRLTEEQWEVMTGLLDALTTGGPSNKLQAAANRALGMGRRAGPKAQYEVEEHWHRLAQDVFYLVGREKGDALDCACDAVLTQEHGPSDPNRPRDLRKLRKAYFVNLEHFEFLQQLSRENDGDKG